MGRPDILKTSAITRGRAKARDVSGESKSRPQDAAQESENRVSASAAD
jgi:hypothetical protein